MRRKILVKWISAALTLGISLTAAFPVMGAENEEVMQTVMAEEKTDAPSQDTREMDRQFVARLYEKVLLRTADEQGLEDWTNQLYDGTTTGATTAWNFFFSEEFTNKNTDNETYVELLYEAMFDRAADAAGKEDWVDALNQGMSRMYVLKGFVDSEEFCNLCNRYAIRQGTLDTGESRDQNRQVTAFVNRLYTIALGRPADVDGLNDWTGRLLAKAETPKQVAAGFVFSQEMSDRGLDNETYATMLYRTMMGREPDTAGLNDWVNRLQSGTSRESVYDGFADSVEFAAIVNSYGLGDTVPDNSGSSGGNTSSGSSDMVQPHEHIYGEGVLTVAPSSDAPGYMEYTCQECGEKVLKMYAEEQLFEGNGQQEWVRGYWDKEQADKILDSINEYRRSKGHSELTLKDEYVECAKMQLQQAYFGSYDLGTTTASGKSATYLGPVCHSACDGSQFFEHYVLTPGNDGICNASLFEKEGIEVGIAYFNGIEYENYYGVSPVFTNEYQQLRNTIHVGLFIYE